MALSTGCPREPPEVFKKTIVYRVVVVVVVVVVVGVAVASVSCCCFVVAVFSCVVVSGG